MTDLQHLRRAGTTPPTNEGDNDTNNSSERLEGARSVAARSREALARLGRVVRDFRAEDLQNSGGQ